MKSKVPNRLAKEKSPYLLQHAHNPVDWYPWGNEAFRKASSEDKPIFLSIGYSTCHWCHVMERESFEDPEIAELMNDAFVCIKVDREERPDIDQIYMKVAQMVTGSGGWPLNLILTPERKPFYVATYIPKSSRYGAIGMNELIPNVTGLWNNDRDKLSESAEKITNALNAVETPKQGLPLDDLLEQAYDELSLSFDEKYGGFGTRPKFPSPHNMLFLLRYWKRSGNPHALAMVEKTLDSMCRGGIRDHVGMGFHRYSTDQRWNLPHFEKMLYDQALIAIALCEAYIANKKSEYRIAAQEIFEYILSRMTSAEGGFHSAEDADSEGIEGAYYVWGHEDLSNILEPDELHLLERVFHVKSRGNFRDEATGAETGENILFMDRGIGEISAGMGTETTFLRDRLESIMKTLRAHREERVPPFKDDKVLTDWNGLMVAALCVGYKSFGNEEYIKSAIKAAGFIEGKMLHDGHLLFHRYRDGEAGIEGNIDDYAFLSLGLLELYDATFNEKYLLFAKGLMDASIRIFWDDNGGGFFTSPITSKDLIARHKESYDGAIPSGNSVMAMCLVRLSKIIGESEYEERARCSITALSEDIYGRPSAHTYFMMSIDAVIGATSELVIVGDISCKDMMRMSSARNEVYLPHNFTFFKDVGGGNELVPGYSSSMRDMGGTSTAYVCSGHSCKAPTNDPKKMLELLSAIYLDPSRPND